MITGNQIMQMDELQSICQTRLESFLQHYLEAEASAPTLQQAMTYAVMNGGKRIRPLLIYATGRALGASWENLDVAAGAIELIHSYSLVHDDLPAMDNADTRRGKPSCHKAFNEAMAILAGDALQPLAFEILASHPAPLTAEQRLHMIQVLSHASGPHGMVAGQVKDIEGVHSVESLTEMYHLKTGALLTASVKLGIIAANIQDTAIVSALEIYAKNLGLAFQIQDDLLDIEGEAHLLGKPAQLDSHHQKNTYPVLSGIPETRHLLEKLYADALEAIAFLGEKAQPLRDIAHTLSQRKK